jgi:competence protein ComEA
MDRTTSPWRALEDLGGPLPESAPTTADRLLHPPGHLLLAGGLGLSVVLAAILILTGSNGSSVVSVNSTGGDSASLPSGAGSGSVVAGGDGGGAAGQRPDGPSAADSGSVATTELVVEVAGAVAHPGLYHLAAGTRVADAIAAAGGYGPRVDIARATAELNLAARVADGDRILVPSRGDPAPTIAPGRSPGAASPPARSGPVDLNRASAAELDALPGVGPVTVARIIASRLKEAFRSVADLRTRKLVGPAEYARIQKLVTVH